MDVTPSLFFADGTEYRLPVVHLEAAGVAEIDVRYAIHDAPAALRSHVSAFGMAGATYSWSWPALILTIQNQDAIASLDTHSAAQADITTVHPALKSAESQQVIRGTWWAPTARADGYIAVQNPSLTAKQVDIELSDHGGIFLTRKTVTLSTHGTAFYKLSELLEAEPNAGDTGDITIRYHGVSRAVVAAAGIEDESTGFSSTPHLIEQRQDLTLPAHPVTIQAAGLMMGKPDPAMLFPTGTVFTPFTVLHNVSTHSVVATVSLTSDGLDGKTETRTVAQLPLAAGQSQTVDYASYLNVRAPSPILPPIPIGIEGRPGAETPARTPAPGILGGEPGGGFAHVSIAYQGREGVLLADVGSVDQSGNYVFEVAPVIAAPSMSKIICFWELHGNRDTMVSVWNYTTAAQDLELKLLYSGGQYRIPIHLEANKAYNLDMMTLVHSRVPDPDGVVIPDNIINGSAMLSGKGGEADKISVAATASTFSPEEGDCHLVCVNCNGNSGFIVIPDLVDLAVAASQQLTPSATLSTGTTYTPSGTWSTANTSVATVSTAGTVTAAAIGSTTVTFSVLDVPITTVACGGELCPDVTIQVPVPVNVPPTLTGTGHDIWYFGPGITSQSSGATQFQYSVTLTAHGSGTATWNVSSGNSEVTLTLSGSTAAVVSSGSAFSSTKLDVAITVTMDGVTSAPYQITTHVPSAMSFASYTHTCNATFGYEDFIQYDVYDQLGTSLTASYIFDFNENFTTPFFDVNSNWGSVNSVPATALQGQVVDEISGVVVNQSPSQSPTPVCSGNTVETEYATQDWYVGSLLAGQGVLLQTDQWTRYADMAAHLNIEP